MALAISKVLSIWNNGEGPKTCEAVEKLTGKKVEEIESR
jgi:hypothetical protein